MDILKDLLKNGYPYDIEYTYKSGDLFTYSQGFSFGGTNAVNFKLNVLHFAFRKVRIVDEDESRLIKEIPNPIFNFESISILFDKISKEEFEMLFNSKTLKVMDATFYPITFLYFGPEWSKKAKSKKSTGIFADEAPAFSFKSKSKPLPEKVKENFSQLLLLLHKRKLDVLTFGEYNGEPLQISKQEKDKFITDKVWAQIHPVNELTDKINPDAAQYIAKFLI